MLSKDDRRIVEKIYNEIQPPFALNNLVKAIEIGLFTNLETKTGKLHTSSVRSCVKTIDSFLHHGELKYFQGNRQRHKNAVKYNIRSGQCERCPSLDPTVEHHLKEDGENIHNNHFSNVANVCLRCHGMIHEHGVTPNTTEKIHFKESPIYSNLNQELWKVLKLDTVRLTDTFKHMPGGKY